MGPWQGQHILLATEPFFIFDKFLKRKFKLRWWCYHKAMLLRNLEVSKPEFMHTNVRQGNGVFRNSQRCYINQDLN